MPTEKAFLLSNDAVQLQCNHLLQQALHACIMQVSKQTMTSLALTCLPFLFPACMRGSHAGLLSGESCPVGGRLFDYSIHSVLLLLNVLVDCTIGLCSVHV